MMNGAGRRRQRGKPPPWLWPGAGLLILFWWFAWFGPAPISEHTFFPLWLGYILLVDGLTYWRSGHSLLASDWRRFGLLFCFSVPLWWLFEAANRFLGNWEYVLPYPYHPVTYALLASLAFSTVIPALFVTVTFWRTFPLFARPRRWIRLDPSIGGLITISAVGLVLVVLALGFPRIAFPLVWIGFFLLFDPINRLLGNKSLAEEVASRRWDTVLVLFAAGLTCGFLWELWNWDSLPKWVYHVPYANQPTLFEMPLLGYGGYLPFVLEVYAAYHLLHWLVFRQRDERIGFGEVERQP
ncbi:MAG: hypothetical protein M3457_12325 [Chloroflexota bacterium]|nr:hypothetical protein [Chloroflexota bacterium]